jgi:RHS repeat-associated protein
LLGSAAIVTFKYDFLGRRVYKQSPTATSIFVYDGDNLVETTNGSGSEVAGYTQTENIDEPLAMLRGTTTSYYEVDGLGSITSLSNSSGSLVQTNTYDSFGNQTASSGSLTNFFRYTGREFDAESGLYFNRARYYDPQVARFLNEDPIRFSGGINFYSYTGNSPIDFGDQSGLCKSACEKLLEQMERLVNATRGNNSGGFKGLAQRFKQYLQNVPGEGYADAGHVEQYENIQNGLKKLLEEFNKNNCGDPPPLVKEWSTKPLPVPGPTNYEIEMMIDSGNYGARGWGEIAVGGLMILNVMSGGAAAGPTAPAWNLVGAAAF